MISMTSSEPKITVLMSVYNGEKYLREAVDSILSQTFTDFEFLIIDDASTDRTPEILRSYKDPRIMIVTNKENLGLTKSLNKGLALARGEYIARMDADDISLQERFEKQLMFLETHPDIVLVGTSFQAIDYEGNLLEDFILPRYILPTNIHYCDLLKSNFFVHGSVIFRREVVEKLSGYNELFRRCQDYALWLQMAKSYSLYIIPDVLYKLRIHDDSVSKKGNESILYHILAVRIAEGSISDDLIEEIRLSGIRCLQNCFNNRDWVYYHTSMAMICCSNGDLKRARQEYWNLLCREPWNTCNLVNLMRTFLGNTLMNMTNSLYITFTRRWVHMCQRR